MELLSRIFSSALLILSRRNIYKYMIGEIDLTPDELDKIQEYLEKIRPLQIKNDKPNLIRQVEQKKIPYLRDLSIDELDFLLEARIDLNGLLAVIYAKGGMLSAFGSITWDKTNQKYNKINIWIRLFTILFATVVCFVIPFMIYIAIVIAFSEFGLIRLVAKGITFLGASLLPILMFTLISNMVNKMKMLEREYPFLFVFS